MCTRHCSGSSPPGTADIRGPRPPGERRLARWHRAHSADVIWKNPPRAFARTALAALRAYLDARLRVAATDDHVFFSPHNRRMASSTVNATFRQVLRLAKITPTHRGWPRIHDLRHTFATRALEQCATTREAVARHLVALATYLGHAGIANTYWYLEATPELLQDLSAAAEIRSSLCAMS